MEPPDNKKAVHRLLGLINWLSRFIPNAATVTEPLRCLIRDETEFHWEETQEKAFKTIQKILTSDPVLRYYNVEEDVTISVDASKTGLGAVLLQGNQPVAYASRSLTTSEQNYAQIEKECLAVLYGCERFHQYAYGKEIIIENDHKPLEAIFKKSLVNVPPRIQRMLIRLQKYNITYVYKKGKELHIADALSRAHLKKTPEDLKFQKEIEYLVYCTQKSNSISPSKMEKIQVETRNDSEMQSQ